MDIYNRIRWFYCINWLDTACMHYSMYLCVRLSPFIINTSRLKQNGHHFTDDIFKHIFCHENVYILIEI